MKKAILAVLASIVLSQGAMAAAPGDVTAPIRQFIDGFNSGDTKTAYAAYATGSITIIDEFAPHRWVGPHAAQEWAADYVKHAQASGVTEGKVTYGEATRTEVKGKLAYVVMPTVYLYKEYGKPLQEEGQITAVLHEEAGGWKIRGWTWTGVKPHPAKP